MWVSLPTTEALSINVSRSTETYTVYKFMSVLSYIPRNTKVTGVGPKKMNSYLKIRCKTHPSRVLLSTEGGHWHLVRLPRGSDPERSVGRSWVKPGEGLHRLKELEGERPE